MQAIGIIPARFHSTRLEGKPLADINGKPMLQHVYENGGDYEAKLVVTDNEGKTGTASELIEVYQPPVAIFTLEPTYGKPPLEVRFDASDSYDEDGEKTQDPDGVNRQGQRPSPSGVANVL